MMRDIRAYLGHGVSIAFDGYQFRLFGYRNAIPFNIFLDQDALDKFQSFIELVERAEAHP